VYDKLYTVSSTKLSTRERILETTWHLMEQRRGQGVRIEDIAEMAGVSRQAVYLHFASRAELLTATARYLDDVLHGYERSQQICAGKTGISALDAYIEWWGNYIPDIYGLAKALMTVKDTDEAAATAWNDRMQASYNLCLQVIRGLTTEGVLAPMWTVEEAADFLWAAISIQTWETLVLERGWTNTQYIEHAQQAMRRMLVQDK
jgi:AcrR family transcriptional regulator